MRNTAGTEDPRGVLLPYELAGRKMFAFPERDCVWVEVEGCTPLRFDRTEPSLETTAYGGTAMSWHDVIEIHYKLNQRSANETEFNAVRLQAFCHLLWAGALRPHECLGLNLQHVVERGENGKLRVKEICLLGPTDPERDLGYYAFWLDPDTFRFLHAYLKLAILKGWIEREALDGPVFVASRGFQGKPGHERWSMRALERAWDVKRDAMELRCKYTLQDFRHMAILGFPGTLEERAQFARLSERDIERRYSIKDAFGFGKMWLDMYNAYERLHKEMGPLHEAEDVRVVPPNGSE